MPVSPSRLTHAVLAAMVLAATAAVAAEPATLSPQEREIARAVEAQLEEKVQIQRTAVLLNRLTR